MSTNLYLLFGDGHFESIVNVEWMLDRIMYALHVAHIYWSDKSTQSHNICRMQFDRILPSIASDFLPSNSKAGAHNREDKSCGNAVCPIPARRPWPLSVLFQKRRLTHPCRAHLSILLRPAFEYLASTPSQLCLWCVLLSIPQSCMQGVWGRVHDSVMCGRDWWRKSNPDRGRTDEDGDPGRARPSFQWVREPIFSSRDARRLRWPIMVQVLRCQ